MKAINPRAFVMTLCLLIAMLSYGNTLWIFAKAQLAQILIAQAWSETLDSGKWQRPWHWAETWPVARIQHPETGSDFYILESTDGSSLAFGPGHQLGTALPGENGASLVGGHRDTHFRFLKDAQLKDELLLQNTNGDWSSYQIQNWEIHNINEDQLLLDQNEDQLVLVTCYPFDAINPGGPLRLVVYAEKQSVT